jgi:hypothetical protein
LGVAPNLLDGRNALGHHPALLSQSFLTGCLLFIERCLVVLYVQRNSFVGRIKLGFSLAIY